MLAEQLEMQLVKVAPLAALSCPSATGSKTLDLSGNIGAVVCSSGSIVEKDGKNSSLHCLNILKLLWIALP